MEERFNLTIDGLHLFGGAHDPSLGNDLTRDELLATAIHCAGAEVRWVNLDDPIEEEVYFPHMIATQYGAVWLCEQTDNGTKMRMVAQRA